MLDKEWVFYRILIWNCLLNNVNFTDLEKDYKELQNASSLVSFDVTDWIKVT